MKTGQEFWDKNKHFIDIEFHFCVLLVSISLSLLSDKISYITQKGTFLPFSKFIPHVDQ